MLGVPRESWAAGSFESGQMVIDKRRHWRGLLTAVWLNTYAHFWWAGGGEWGLLPFTQPTSP